MFEGLFRPMPLLEILFVALIIFDPGKLPAPQVYPVGQKCPGSFRGIFVISGSICLNLFKNEAQRRPEA